jgi:hypothetical protein
MSRKALIPLLAAAFLAVPAIHAAQAYTALNSSRSNIYRSKHVTGTKQHGTERTTVKGSKLPARKKICVIYQAGHNGDNRYCSQWGTIN